MKKSSPNLRYSSCNRNRLTKASRRLLLILPLVLILLISGTAVRAQTVIKGWVMAAESPAHIDVSYQIVKCNPTSNAELHLNVFNEKTAADTAKFNVVIADAALGQSFTTLVTQPFPGLQMLIANCGNTALSDLKIAIPANYDPAALTVTITFIP